MKVNVCAIFNTISKQIKSAIKTEKLITLTGLNNVNKTSYININLNN
jgi:hypothetical protein